MKNQALCRRLDQVTPVPCPCGESTRIITRSDNLGFNLHVTLIGDSTRHYHRECTEVYTILEGTGKISLDDQVEEVGPGSVVVIPPLVRHRLWSDKPEKPVRVHIVGIPAWDPEDEHFE